MTELDTNLVICTFWLLGRGLWFKTDTLIRLLSVVSRIFEKLVNHRLADHIKKYGLFSYNDTMGKLQEKRADVF